MCASQPLHRLDWPLDLRGSGGSKNGWSTTGVAHIGRKLATFMCLEKNKIKIPTLDFLEERAAATQRCAIMLRQT